MRGDLLRHMLPFGVPESQEGRNAMANPVVHFEVTGKDGKKLQDFYSSAFGW